MLVTGAAGGIGRATCQLLTKQSFHVFAADRDEMALSSMAQKNITPIRMDIAKSESVNSAIAVISKITNFMVGLVNLAGTFDHFSLAEVDHVKFMDLVEANSIDHQRVTSAAFPVLREERGSVKAKLCSPLCHCKPTDSPKSIWTCRICSSG